MAISEANAALDLLTKLLKAIRAVRSYKQSSDDLEASTEKVSALRESINRWKERLLKYPVPLHNEVQSRLKYAYDRLEILSSEVEAMKEKSCCWMVWDKVTSPDRIALSLNNVNEALDNILNAMREGYEAVQILEKQADKIQAQIDFKDDAKYVPLMKTFRKIKVCLEEDDSSNNLILLHGGSGEGKSSLVKYIILMYSKEWSPPPSGSSSNRFRDGIVFLRCGENADSRSLLVSMGKKLGYQMGAYDQSDDLQHQEVANGSRGDVDTLRRTLIKRLELLTSVLIVLDDVWEQQTIKDLLIPVLSVKYLITTQNMSLWNTRHCIGIGRPSEEEARKILINHTRVQQSKQIELPSDVKNEVDSLLRDVGYHPLVLANLGAFIPIRDFNFPGLSKWKKLRKELMSALKTADEKNRQATPAVFNEPYERSVLASLTMAFNKLTPLAQTLLHCLAICSAYGVDENVLKVWFKAITGSYDELDFDFATENLKECSVIEIAGKEGVGIGELSNQWSMHDLGQQLLQEMKSEDIEAVTLKLTEGDVQSAASEGGSSDSDCEKLLSTALCFLYGNSDCSKNAESKLALDWLYKRWSRLYKQFLKSFTKLLHPEYPKCEMEWQNKAHAISRTIILQYLATGQMADIDGEISLLLEAPETALATCLALTSISWTSNLHGDVLPRTEKTLLEKIYKYLDKPPQPYNELALYGEALNVCSGVSNLLALLEEPQFSRLTTFVIKILQWPWGESPLKDDVGIAESLLSMLWRVVAMHHGAPSSKIARKKLASTPGLTRVLMGFLDGRSFYQSNLQEWSSRVFLAIHCQDDEIKAKTILLPDVLDIVVGLLEGPHLHVNAAHILKELAWTVVGAEKIVSHPRALSRLLTLLIHTVSRDTQCAALTVLAQLARILPESGIIESLWARLKLLVHQDSHPDVLRVVAIIITNQNYGIRLVEIIKLYEKLLAANVRAATRAGALTALCIFVSERTTHGSVVKSPHLLENMLESLREDGAISVLNSVCETMRRAITESKQIEEERKKRLMVEIVQRCLNLTQNANTTLQLEAWSALQTLASAHELYEVMVTDTKILGHFLESVDESKTHAVLETVAKILCLIINRARDAEQTHQISTDAREYEQMYQISTNVLDRSLKAFARLLEDSTKPEIQTAATRALVYLTNQKEVHSVMVGEANILRRLLKVVNEDADPSALVPAAWIMRNCLMKEDPGASRSSIMRTHGTRYVTILASGKGVDLQAEAALAIGILSMGTKNRGFVVVLPGALDSLTALLSNRAVTPSVARKVCEAVQLIDDNRTESRTVDDIVLDFKAKILKTYLSLLEKHVPTQVQEAARQSLTSLLLSEANRRLFADVCPEGQDHFIGFLNSFAGRVASQSWARLTAMECLTLIDQGQAEEMHLVSADAHAGRARAKLYLKLFERASVDYDRAIQLAPSWDRLYCERAFARAQLGNTAEALEDLNSCVELYPTYPLYWQERGVLKRIMRDCDGAVSDLNEALRLGGDDYESLKHRGYVKFLKGDEDGARLDAEHALTVKQFHTSRYLPSYADEILLGVMSVTYLGFELV